MRRRLDAIRRITHTRTWFSPCQKVYLILLYKMPNGSDTPKGLLVSECGVVDLYTNPWFGSVFLGLFYTP